MTDATVSIRDAGLNIHALLFKLLGDGSKVPYHVEAATQRDALIDAIADSKGITNSELRAAAIAIIAGASEAHVGQVGGHAVVAAVTPAVSTTAYSSGDVIGGKMTFPNFGRVAGGTGLIQMAAIMSKSTQNFSADLLLFHSDPTASSFTDNAVLALNVADFDKLLGVVSVSSWTALGSPSFAQATQLAMAYKVAAGQADIYGVLVARGTPTLTSVSDLKIALKALLD